MYFVLKNDQIDRENQRKNLEIKWREEILNYLVSTQLVSLKLSHHSKKLNKVREK